MSKYILWDKTSDIYTLGVDKSGKSHFSAAEYIRDKAPWAANPNVKVIVANNAINGLVFMEFSATVDQYKKMGAAITDGMTDTEILDAIEYFEDHPPVAGPTVEERTAAALEFIAVNSLPDA